MFAVNEQETVISYGPCDDCVTIYTNIPHMVKKYRKLSSLDTVHVVRDEDDAIEIRVDKKSFSATIRKPRVLDPEERARRSELMKRIAAMQNNKNKQQKGETE